MKALVYLFTILILCLGLISCSLKTTEPFANTVETPAFVYEPGVYWSGVYLIIDCSTPGVTIRYTINGTNPNDNSPKLTEPLRISSSSLIKVVAYKKGWNHSAVLSGFYQIHYHEIIGARIRRIIASPDTIYADNGISQSNISVTVKDWGSSAVPGINVIFLSSMGNIIPSATTDEDGIATSTFKAENETGIATILAILRINVEEYPDLLVCADTSAVLVTIAGNPPISSINLEFPSAEDPYPMNPEQSITVRARARNILGNFVPDNTLIKFTSTIGYFIDAEGNPLGIEADIRTVNGWATIIFNSGTESGTGLVQARISNQRGIRDIVVNP